MEWFPLWCHRKVCLWLLLLGFCLFGGRPWQLRELLSRWCCFVSFCFCFVGFISESAVTRYILYTDKMLIELLRTRVWPFCCRCRLFFVVVVAVLRPRCVKTPMVDRVWLFRGLLFFVVVLVLSVLLHWCLLFSAFCRGNEKNRQVPCAAVQWSFCRHRLAVCGVVKAGFTGHSCLSLWSKHCIPRPLLSFRWSSLRLAPRRFYVPQWCWSLVLNRKS